MKLRTFPVSLVVALLAGPTVAQDPAGSRGGVSPVLHGTLDLSLDNAIRMGMVNNLDVEVVRHDPLIAYEGTEIALGAYDPLLSSDFDYSKTELPTANALLGRAETKSKVWGGGSALRGLVPLLGTNYGFTFESTKEVGDLSIVGSLRPKYDSGWSLDVEQPLLKDLIWNQEWTQVKTSEVVYGVALENFRRDVMDIVQSIEDAYWTLIADQEQLGVAEKSVETAQALLEQTKTQFEVGVVSKVEVVEAEAGLAQRQVELIRAKNRYLNSQDVLIDRVLGQGLRPDSTLEIQPTDRPEEFIAYQIDSELATARAFEYRPELATALLEIERREIDLKFAQNQRLPGLAAVVRYGNRGLSGDQPPGCRIPGFGPDGFQSCETPAVGPTWQDSFTNWFSRSASEQVAVGGRFSIPLGNRAARHTVSQRELELRRSHVQKRRLEQNIILEVRNAIRNLESASQGIEAAKRSTAAAAEQLRAERIRLEYGESTPFQVLLRESDYVDAQSSEIGAYQVYRLSVTGLDRSQGTILRSRNIAIDQVAALR